VETKEFLFAVCRCGRLSVWFSVCGADQGVLVCRVLMRSFSGLNLLPHVVWFSICATDRGVLVFGLLMGSFVCLVLFLQPRQRSYFPAKGVEDAVSVVCGLDFLCEESGLFVC
jgi:hypothetical protein